MKRSCTYLLVLISTLTGLHRAQAEAWYLDAGVKVWYAEPHPTDRALMLGPSIAASLADTYWVRGFFLFGEYDFVRSNQPRVVQDFSVRDAEWVGGINWDIFHVGFGLRSSTIITQERLADGPRVRTPNALGPALVAGISQSLTENPWGFEDSPWGWYAGASWMFYDFEDDNGEHINFELGITHVSNNLYKSLGYRYKHTFDHDRMEGFMATLMFEF